MTTLRQRMIEDLAMRNLSEATSRAYVRQVAKFAKYFGKSPELLGPEEVRRYQIHLINERRVSWSTVNQASAGLAVLLPDQTTLKKNWAIGQIRYAKREKPLPVALSVAEVARFFQGG